MSRHMLFLFGMLCISSLFCHPGTIKSFFLLFAVALITTFGYILVQMIIDWKKFQNDYKDFFSWHAIKSCFI